VSDTTTTPPAAPTSAEKLLPRGVGDVVTIAATQRFELTIRKVLSTHRGPRMMRWPVRADTPESDKVAVAFIGPDLPPQEMIAQAQLLDRDHPHIYLVLCTNPVPGLFEHALRAGVRDVVSPDATEDAIYTVLERALEIAANRRASAPVPVETPEQKRKRVITVLSPKGGVGKTFVSSNLAVALLANQPGSVAVVDLDLQFGDIGNAMHLTPEHTIVDAARAMNGEASMLKVFLTPHESGLYVMSAPEDPAEADEISYENSITIVRLLSETFPTVLVDTCAGLDSHALAAAEAATDLVFVCSVDVASVRSLRKELDALERLGMTTQRRHLVLNRIDAPGGARPEDVEVALGMEASMSIPTDRAVLAAANQGIPLTYGDQRSNVSKRFLQFANTFFDEPVYEEQKSSFFKFRRR
jgi:pilus assembly protein CpaE